MYESVFGFRERPFPAAPSPRLYVPADSIEHARSTVARTIERAEGPALIVGPSGSGKSLLCQLLAEQFRETFRIAMLASARLCTRRALLQNILFELKLPYRDMEEGELRLSLIDHLEPTHGEPGMLLIVDEGHTMPLRLLEEIRMITNLVRDGQPRVRLVVAGGPQLEERFANPKLESLNQRIAARCYLQALSLDETRQFVATQVERVGGDVQQCFSDDALQSVFRASDGIPRLINQICDHALMLASVDGDNMITAQRIDEAWADLQQLPTPWNGANLTSEPTESVVEFGQLDDDEICGPGVVGDEASSEVAWDPPQEQVELRLAPATLPAVAATTDVVSDEVAIGEVASIVAGQVESDPPVVLSEEIDDPFDESFDEEEVIIDQFAMLDAALENALPVFHPGVGDSAALFDSFRIEATPLDVGDETIAAMPEPLSLCDTKGDADKVSRDVDIATNDAPTSIAIAGREAEDPPSPLPLEPTDARPPKRQPPDDRDLIIIEDDEETTTPHPHKAPARAYREQYAQLFGRLRNR